jgi:hypothetical protein
MEMTNFILKSCKWFRDKAHEDPIVVVVNEILYEQSNWKTTSIIVTNHFKSVS